MKHKLVFYGFRPNEETEKVLTFEFEIEDDFDFQKYSQMVFNEEGIKKPDFKDYFCVMSHIITDYTANQNYYGWFKVEGWVEEDYDLYGIVEFDGEDVCQSKYSDYAELEEYKREQHEEEVAMEQLDQMRGK